MTKYDQDVWLDLQQSNNCSENSNFITQNKTTSIFRNRRLLQQEQQQQQTSCLRKRHVYSKSESTTSEDHSQLCFSGKSRKLTRASASNNSSWAYFNRGSQYLKEKKYIYAVSEFSNAISHSPHFLKSYCLRAEAFINLHRYSSAIEDLTRVIELTPGESELFRKRAFCYEQLHESKRAIDDYSSVIEFSPVVSPEIFLARGNLYLNNSANSNDMTKALEDFTEAIHRYPRLVQAYKDRSETYVKLQHYDLAIEDLDSVVKLEERSGSFNTSHQTNYHHNSYTNRSNNSSHYSNLMKPQSPVYESFARRGSVLMVYADRIQQQSFSDDKYCSIEEGNITSDITKQKECRFNEPYTNETARDLLKQAIMNFDRVLLDFDDKCLDALYSRGVAYLRLGNYQQADEDFSLGIEINPLDLQLRIDRVKLYKEQDSASSHPYKRAISELQALVNEFSEFFPADSDDYTAFSLKNNSISKSSDFAYFDVHFLLAEYLIETSKSKQAIKVYDRLLPHLEKKLQKSSSITLEASSQPYHSASTSITLPENHRSLVTRQVDRVLIGRARLYVATHQFDLAREDYQRLLGINSKTKMKNEKLESSDYEKVARQEYEGIEEIEKLYNQAKADSMYKELMQEYEEKTVSHCTKGCGDSAAAVLIASSPPPKSSAKTKKKKKKKKKSNKRQNKNDIDLGKLGEDKKDNCCSAALNVSEYESVDVLESKVPSSSDVGVAIEDRILLSKDTCVLKRDDAPLNETENTNLLKEEKNEVELFDILSTSFPASDHTETTVGCSRDEACESLSNEFNSTNSSSCSSISSMLKGCSSSFNNSVHTFVKSRHNPHHSAMLLPLQFNNINQLKCRITSDSMDADSLDEKQEKANLFYSFDKNSKNDNTRDPFEDDQINDDKNLDSLSTKYDPISSNAIPASSINCSSDVNSSGKIREIITADEVDRHLNSKEESSPEDDCGIQKPEGDCSIQNMKQEDDDEEEEDNITKDAHEVLIDERYLKKRKKQLEGLRSVLKSATRNKDVIAIQEALSRSERKNMTNQLQEEIADANKVLCDDTKSSGNKTDHEEEEEDFGSTSTETIEDENNHVVDKETVKMRKVEEKEESVQYYEEKLAIKNEEIKRLQNQLYLLTLQQEQAHHPVEMVHESSNKVENLDLDRSNQIPGPIGRNIDINRISQNPNERMLMVYSRVDQLVSFLSPTVESEKQRHMIFQFINSIVEQTFSTVNNGASCNLQSTGSYPLKTYLPDGDLDLCIGVRDKSSLIAGVSEVKALANFDIPCEDEWCMALVNALCANSLSKNTDNRGSGGNCFIRNVTFVKAKVKVVRCTVNNISVDVTCGQMGAINAVGLWEEFDRRVGKQHLFKRSLVLLKSWCNYDTKATILGAADGGLTTYALNVMVVALFNLHEINHPIELLELFLSSYMGLDWRLYAISIFGLVEKNKLLHEVTFSDPGMMRLMSPTDPFYEKLKSENSNAGPCMDFRIRAVNVIDPLHNSNNVAGSVTAAKLEEIQQSLHAGFGRLTQIKNQDPNVLVGIDSFFQNSWKLYGRGWRPDVLMHPLASTWQPHGV